MSWRAGLSDRQAPYQGRFAAAASETAQEAAPGFTAVRRKAAISFFAAAISARKAVLPFSAANTTDAATLPASTSLAQCTPQTARLSP